MQSSPRGLHLTTRLWQKVIGCHFQDQVMQDCDFCLAHSVSTLVFLCLEKANSHGERLCAEVHVARNEGTSVAKSSLGIGELCPSTKSMNELRSISLPVKP
jgi:hypothetical protein